MGLLLTWVYEGRMNLVNSFLDWASGGVLQAGRLEECFKGRLEWRSRTTWVAGEGSGEDVLQVGRLEECFKLGVWRSASRSVWSGEVVLPGWLEKALEKTYYKMGKA